MAKRSSQSFVKRQKEMARKERAQLKNQKRLERKLNKGEGGEEEILVPLDGPILHETFSDEPEAEVAVEETAAGLESLGLRTADRVGILGENRPEWLYADLATLCSRATAVTI